MAASQAGDRGAKGRVRRRGTAGRPAGVRPAHGDGSRRILPVCAAWRRSRGACLVGLAPTASRRRTPRATPRVLRAAPTAGSIRRPERRDHGARGRQGRPPPRRTRVHRRRRPPMLTPPRARPPHEKTTPIAMSPTAIHPVATPRRYRPPTTSRRRRRGPAGGRARSPGSGSFHRALPDGNPFIAASRRQPRAAATPLAPASFEECAPAEAGGLVPIGSGLGHR